eukprot:TRINITY_DN10420_c0_g1_i1.p1 TRINITY_DN10420_c0_g1~~TRINITY_DN10420_c0_g1_i1.p1  ORF type:complete len:424 (-),score=29.88 TRINITY_DN10420_c0_g1_i1:27-1163(-)
MEVKYTDIDYVVYTDAARHVWQGNSPYERATYRYTPLVALALTPNIFLHNAFGKIVFSIADLLQGVLIYAILRLRNVASFTAAICAACQLLNPVMANVATRGNADPLIGVFVMATLWLLLRRRTFLAGLCYGLAIHLKIYPVVYGLAIFLLLGPEYEVRPHIQTRSRKQQSSPLLRRFFTASRLWFGLGSCCVFFWLLAVFYAQYGWDFLHHSYLYHFGRVDHRHNFSPYFYLLYLTNELPAYASLASRMAFLPQVILVLIICVRWYKDLPMSMLLSTMVFVAFNKVCTVQYFVWYQSLLPLVLPFTRLRFRWRGAMLLAVWLLAQGLWLLSAYTLEFLGLDSFRVVWLASLLFAAVNVWLICELASKHKFTPVLIVG